MVPEVPVVLRESRGGALLLVVIVLAVLLSLAASLMSLAGTESVTGVRQLNQIQAHYIAEAGVESALAALKLDTQWRQGLTNLAYAGGCMDKVTVTLSQGESAGDIYVLVIKSTGSYSGARRTVEVKVRVSPVAYALPGLGSLPGTTPLNELRISGPLTIDGDIFLAGSCHLQWDVTLNGTLRSGGDVVIQNPARVNGDVRARGSISAGENTVAGQLYPYTNLDVPPFCPLTDGDLDVIRDAARGYGGGHYFAGDHTFTVPELINMSGIYFVEGRATVAGQYSGRATIVSPGDIYLPGPLYAAAGGANKLGLIAGGSVCAAEGAHLVEAVVYASSYVARGAFTEHRGGIIASDLELSGSLKLGALSPGLPPAIPAEIKVLHWKELYPMF